MTDRAVDFLSKNGIKGRTKGQRQFLAEAEIGETQTHHDVDRPGVEAPVTVGDPHRVNRTLVVQLRGASLIRKGIIRIFPGRRVVEIEQRLRDGEEQQANTHTGREQHREPREVRELRPRIVIAEANVTEAAAHQMEANRQHDAESADVIPAQRCFDPSADRRINAVGEIDVQGGEDDEDHHHTLGGEPHTAVQSRKKSSFCNEIRRIAVAVSHHRSSPLLLSTRDRRATESTKPLTGNHLPYEPQSEISISIQKNLGQSAGF